MVPVSDGGRRGQRRGQFCTFFGFVLAKTVRTDPAPLFDRAPVLGEKSEDYPARVVFAVTDPLPASREAPCTNSIQFSLFSAYERVANLTLPMKLPLYHIDAFTSRLFGGNPAAVVILNDWLPDATLQAIAAENNLSETAFVVPEEGTSLFPLRLSVAQKS